MNKSLEKIKSAKPSEIIRAMVKGLKERHTVIDMHTYGIQRNKVCYGCAATNCLIEMGLDKTKLGTIEDGSSHGFTNYYGDIVDNIETAVEALRSGLWFSFVRILETIVLAPDDDLPELDDDYSEEDLVPYTNYAILFEKAGY